MDKSNEIKRLMRKDATSGTWGGDSNVNDLGRLCLVSRDGKGREVTSDRGSGRGRK